MTIYEVIQNDNQIRFYFFATKKEAVAYKRELDVDNKKNDFPLADIKPVNFPATRAGIAEAMNWVITMTCFNEG